ncbi:MAG: hypothetical protein EOP48_18015 [Sphingobacteriales bacterium]|nr:MAG: hypothetical protein EOP48_18015 [Sphingobacteriales bacterium]
MKIISAILLLTFLSCSSSKDKPKEQEGRTVPKEMNNTNSPNFDMDKGGITGKAVRLDVSYAAIECTCPQWFETKEMHDTIKGRQYFYLEQGKDGVVNADTLFNGDNLPIQLILTGQFYNKEGYPKNYHPAKGEPEPARVFKYNKIEIVQQGGQHSKKTAYNIGFLQQRLENKG